MTEEQQPTIRILVIEDDQYSRDMLVRRLEARGFAAEGAEDGQPGMDRLSVGAPSIDLVLLDMSMPNMDGVEVLRQVRSRWTREQLPVIMVSAHGDPEDVVKGLEAGANDYVVKPVNMPILMARMRVSLQVKQSVSALLQAERQRVMLESLGAACHHLAQPMTVASGRLQLLAKDLPNGLETWSQELADVQKHMNEAAGILHNLQDIVEYRTVPYTAGSNIIDIRLTAAGDDPAREPEGAEAT